MKLWQERSLTTFACIPFILLSRLLPSRDPPPFTFAGGHRLGVRRSAGTALSAVAAVCAVASIVFVGVSMQENSVRAASLLETDLWGWTKDSLESGDAKISAEEVGIFGFTCS